ncbi:MAG: hypothetical protein HND57_04635 [Planctomycetes bacterium]|nr:hypothetical protein [Planctomycetota bacterium]
MTNHTPADDPSLQRSLDELLDIVDKRNASEHDHEGTTESADDSEQDSAAIQSPTRGLSVTINSPDTLLEAVEAAFRYRGDVEITLADGTVHRGYLFDRRIVEPPTDSTARLITPDADGNRITIRCADIRLIVFSGRDAAAGKSWEHWLRKHGAHQHRCE